MARIETRLAASLDVAQYVAGSKEVHEAFMAFGRDPTDAKKIEAVQEVLLVVARHTQTSTERPPE